MLRPVSQSHSREPLTTEQREKVLAAGNFVEPLPSTYTKGETAVEGLDLDAIEKWLETSGSSGLGGRVGALAHYVHQLVAALRQAQQQAAGRGKLLVDHVEHAVGYLNQIERLRAENEKLRQQLHSIGESFAAGEFVSRASNT